MCVYIEHSIDETSLNLEIPKTRLKNKNDTIPSYKFFFFFFPTFLAFIPQIEIKEILLKGLHPC